ncbi:hypothetical protein [Glycomyces tarimensis]
MKPVRLLKKLASVTAAGLLVLGIFAGTAEMSASNSTDLANESNSSDLGATDPDNSTDLGDVDTDNSTDLASVVTASGGNSSDLG